MRDEHRINQNIGTRLEQQEALNPSPEETPLPENASPVEVNRQPRVRLHDLKQAEYNRMEGNLQRLNEESGRAGIQLDDDRVVNVYARKYEIPAVL